MSSDNEPSTDYPPPGADLDGQAAAANLLGIRGSGQLRRREYRETSVRALEIVTGRVELLAPAISWNGRRFTPTYSAESTNGRACPARSP
ncbi:hypothetical protein [Nocardia beijingensis]